MSKGQSQGEVIENMIFINKTRNMTVIPNFHGISTEKSIYGIMFVMHGDLQDQKVNFKVKKTLFSINKNSSKCNTYFYVILNRESICGDSFGDYKDILNIKK